MADHIQGESKPQPPKIDLNKYKQQPQSSQTQEQIPQQERISPEQKLRNEQVARQILFKQTARDNPQFSYLDLFEQQMAEERIAQAKFNSEMAQEEKIIEEKKPAFFQDQKKTSWREDEYEAWKKLQKQTEMNFNPDDKTEEEMRQFFRLNEQGKNAVEDMSAKMFENLHQRLRFRQINFQAFLNKEFNIMNYKSARCSMHCFDDIQRKLPDVNNCLQICRKGLKDCHDFAQQMQKDAEVEVQACTERASKQENLTDPIIHWISCYEKLVLKFDSMEQDIAQEFSNFV